MEKNMANEYELDTDLGEGWVKFIADREGKRLVFTFHFSEPPYMVAHLMDDEGSKFCEFPENHVTRLQDILDQFYGDAKAGEYIVFIEEED